MFIAVAFVRVTFYYTRFVFTDGNLKINVQLQLSFYSLGNIVQHEEHILD